MKLEALLGDFEFEACDDIKSLEIADIATSADKIGSGTLFVLYKSIKFDVKSIIGYILGKMPRAIICDGDLAPENTDIPIIKVADARRILPYLYLRFYGVSLNKMRFIGVTGTNGKSTTATLISKMLREAGQKVGFMGTGIISIDGEDINGTDYSMTTPDPELLYSTLARFEAAGCDTVVMEISSHALHFGKVAPISFDIALFTNLSSEHMDLHGNIEEYYKTKLKLFNQTKLGIFNFDDYYSRKAYSEVRFDKASVGVVRKGDAIATDVRLNGLDGIKFIYRYGDRLLNVKSALAGAYNVYNAIMALTAAIAYGVPPCIAKRALGKVTRIDGRLETVSEKPRVIIDYAHTVEALTNVLKTIISVKKAEQKLILVFGCGGERDREKRPQMATVAEKYADLSIVTTDNSRGESVVDILEDILSGFKNTKSRKVITSRAAAIQNAILSAADQDIIAVIGKGHERYNIDKSGYHAFDERKIIREALNKREDIKLKDADTVNSSTNA